MKLEEHIKYERIGIICMDEIERSKVINKLKSLGYKNWDADNLFDIAPHVQVYKYCGESYYQTSVDISSMMSWSAMHMLNHEQDRVNNTPSVPYTPEVSV